MFCEWIQSFSSIISMELGRRVAFLLGYFSVHFHPSKLLPNLENVTNIYLPPNNISKLQPMDAGITASFKKGYRRLQCDRFLDLADEGAKDICNIYLLTGMRWLPTACVELRSAVIANCF